MRTRNVIALVLSVGLMAALMPVGVLAASGQLVHITDPNVPGRRARVTTSNSLQAESRAGTGPGVLNGYWSFDTLESERFAVVTGPDRLALTQMTLGSVGPSNGTTTGHHYVDIVSYVQTTGSGACGSTSTGWDVKTLNRLVVRNFHPTMQVEWSGPALLAPQAAVGKRSCVVVRLNTFTTGSVVHASATGYRVEG